jgi:mono/diheme cytochrome c family protein
MKRFLPILVASGLALTSCSRLSPLLGRKANLGPHPTAFGAALVEVGGSKQAAAVGMTLEQPVVVQVNDSQGNAVQGAAVFFEGASGVGLNPAAALTDASGQVSVEVALGGIPGRYQLLAYTQDKAGKRIELRLDEIALGYQETLGRQLNRQYCARCHDPESTPERVSNFDNLDPKPHAFTEGETLNKFSDMDLTALITHGGPALGKSPQMPPYGYTLGKTDLQALAAYIRAVSDPPYHSPGLVYAKN